MAGALRGPFVLGFVIASAFARPRPAEACTIPQQCTDSDICTTDSCDATGTCQHSHIPGCCTTVAECSDGNVCTTDACNLTTHTCSNASISGCCTSDSACGDGDVCTSDICDPTLHTCSRPAISGCCTSMAQCGDGDPCTEDTCDLAIDRCAYAPIDGCCTTVADCGDGDVCTNDLCSGTNTCSNPSIAGCCTADAECDDGLLCTADTCDLATHACVHSAIPGCCTSVADCTSTSTCTTASCDLVARQCSYQSVAGCCTGAADCADGDPCTADACDVPSGNCSNPAISGCCTSASQCDDLDACTTDGCVGNACAHGDIAGCCNVDAECDDGDACTGDTCTGHVCVHESVPCCVTDADCIDTDPCTVDRCDVGTAECEHPRALSCCTRDLDCVDLSTCTVDACATDTCTHVGLGGCCTSDVDCIDGDACTTDTCDAATGVCSIAAIPDCCLTLADCDDHDACTSDGCDTGSCTHAPIDGCMPDAGPTADAGPVARDAGVGLDGAGPDAATDGGVPSGCTCESAGAQDVPVGGLVLATIVLASLRRRRRRALGALAITAALSGCGSRPPDGGAAPTYDAVQLIFDHDCAGSACHVGATEPGAGLDLTAGVSYDALVDVIATQVERARVAPGFPDASYLYCKLDEDCPLAEGVRMNVDEAGRAISPESIEAIRRWIAAGAQPPPPPPDAPPSDETPPAFGGVTEATPLGETAIALGWAPAVDDVTDAPDLVYAVYRATVAGAEDYGVPVARVTGVTGVDITGLSAGVTYYFVVRATDAAGNSDDNVVEASATTSDATPPAFAGAESASSSGPGQVTVSWSSATDNVDAAVQLRYRIYAASTPGGESFTSPVITTAPGATSATIGGLGSSQPCFVVVRAVDRAGNEDANLVERGAVTLDTVAPTFGGATTATSGPSSVTLAWSPATDDGTASAELVYLVYVATTPGGEVYAAPTSITPAGATSASIGGLAVNTTYYFVVRARDRAGNIDTNTVERFATTPVTSDTQAPTFAGLTSATTTGATTIALGWTAATDNVSAAGQITYQIHRSIFAGTCGAFDFASPTYVTLAGAASFAAGGLSPGTGYCFVVRARDQAGNVDANAITRTATTTGDTTAPTFGGISSATATSTSSVGLGWSAATDDVTASTGVTYLVYVATSPGAETYASPTYTTDPGATAFAATGLAPGTAYYFVVRARDAAGNIDGNTVERGAMTVGDTVAPSFAGATSATAASPSAITVSWTAATDNVTLQSEIVYRAFVATTSGGEDFAAPSPPSVTGATSITLTGLGPSTTYYVVVRAEDQAGNRDGNVAQVSATTLLDSTAPSFAGLGSVAVGADACSLVLSWSAASDVGTSADLLAYPVYRATTSGGESYATPTLTAMAVPSCGADGLATACSAGATGLLPGTRYYFVGRARDPAGNTDTNTTERSAVTMPPTVSFATDVQPILTTNCAKAGCHSATAPAEGLNLSSGASYAGLVGITSTECPPTSRVVRCHPENSYLMWKLNGGGGTCFSGSQMPKTGSLTAAELATIEAWIEQGAPNN